MKKYAKGYYLLHHTSLGWMGAAASAKGLAKVVLPQRSPELVLEQLYDCFEGLIQSPNTLLSDFSNRLDAYFSGQKVVFHDLETDLSWATPFAAKVYSTVKTIPYGQFLTYREVAVAVDCPKGSRAIGGAMARNRLPMLIPCHRVVGSKDIGGFTGAGTEIKRALLNIERV